MLVAPNDGPNIRFTQKEEPAGQTRQSASAPVWPAFTNPLSPGLVVGQARLGGEIKFNSNKMLSLFSKSFKTVEIEPSSSYRELGPVASDVRSCVSVSQTNRLKKERRFFKGRNLRGSDYEDDIKSVVSDNPQMYRCSNPNRKQRNQLLNPKKAKKSFDTVERKMNHIQASLSSADLLSSTQHRATDSCTVEKLRKDLDAKEIFANQ